MIYRILVSQPTPKGEWLEAEDRWNWEAAGYAAWPWTLQGAASAGQCGQAMDEYGLQYPKVTNPRTRFYFTERGWRQVGRFVAEAARKGGYLVKVIRRKNPDPSQIVYADPLQVAILPRRARPRS